jgi:hypothetical protein
MVLPPVVLVVAGIHTRNPVDSTAMPTAILLLLVEAALLLTHLPTEDRATGPGRMEFILLDLPINVLNENSSVFPTTQP